MDSLSFATIRRILQTLIVSATLVLLHALLTFSLQEPVAGVQETERRAWLDEIRSLGTLSVLTLVWLVFGLLEGVRLADISPSWHMTAIGIEWPLLSMLAFEWLTHLPNIAVLFQTPMDLLLPLAASLALLSIVVLHSALSISILIDVCFVSAAWRDSQFWLANVDQHAWYSSMGTVRLGEGAVEPFVETKVLPA